MTVAAVLLAAGRASRFGGGKTSAMLGDRPLADHAAAALRAVAPAHALMVVRPGAPVCDGFARIDNPQADAGLGGSIALGVAEATARGATAVLIALADMPFVSPGHLRRLLARLHGPSSLAASSDGRRRLPPALFGSAWFDELRRLSGDTGARALLGRAEPIVTDPGDLLDVDTTADLAAAAMRLRAAEGAGPGV